MNKSIKVQLKALSAFQLTLKTKRTSDVFWEQVAVLKALSARGLRQADAAGQVSFFQAAVSKCLENESGRGATAARDNRKLDWLGRQQRFSSSQELTRERNNCL